VFGLALLSTHSLAALPLFSVQPPTPCWLRVSSACMWYFLNRTPPAIPNAFWISDGATGRLHVVLHFSGPAISSPAYSTLWVTFLDFGPAFSGPPFSAPQKVQTFAAADQAVQVHTGGDVLLWKHYRFDQCVLKDKIAVASLSLYIVQPSRWTDIKHLV